MPITSEASDSAIIIYADAFDMAALFFSFNAEAPLNYTEVSDAANAPLLRFDNAMDLMGFAQVKHPHASKLFFATEQGQDASEEDAVLIRPGGMVGRTLIATSIHHVGSSEAAARVFKRLKALVGEASREGEGGYVMRGALTRLRDGWRLVMDFEAEPALDLQRSAFE